MGAGDMEDMEVIEIAGDMGGVEEVEENKEMEETQEMDELEDSEEKSEKELDLKDIVDVKVPSENTSEHNVIEVKEDQEEDTELSETKEEKVLEDSAGVFVEEALIGIERNELEGTESSKDDRDTQARPRSLDYYFKFIDTREVDGGSRGGDSYSVSQCCHEVKIQSGR